MNFSTLKRAILLCRAANITPFIWGLHGAGKSTLVRDLCLNNKLGCIDKRLSQEEASDLRGLPDKQNGRTVYLPPADMPIGDMSYEQAQDLIEIENKKPDGRAWELETKLQPRLKDGILFLDEINRCQDDVAQASFQLVLDRRIGQYVLPPGWSIVCAGNFMEGYNTNGFTDPAFLDRFCHLRLSSDESTLPEWVDYMNIRYEVSDRIIEFVSYNNDYLYGKSESSLGFQILPSPRSWEAVAKVLEACAVKDYGEDAKDAVIAGLIGLEMQKAYKNYDLPVKPNEIIKNGIQACLGGLNKILEDKNRRNMAMSLMWGMISKLRGRMDDDNLSKVAVDFTKWMVYNLKDKDIALAFCNQMMIKPDANLQAENFRRAALTNQRIGKMIADWTRNRNKHNFMTRLEADKELYVFVTEITRGKLT